MSEKAITDALGLTPLDEIRKIKEEQVDLPEIFYTEGEIVDDEPKEDSETVKDIDFAKENIKDIIQQGRTSIRDLMNLASQGESARSYEVLSTLMKTMLDANKDYVDLSVKKKYEKEDQPKTATTNVTNNNLVISTADLLKLMKGDKNE